MDLQSLDNPKLAKKKLPSAETHQPTTAIQRGILESRITIWTNTLYVAKVQARVAKAVDSAVLAAEAAKGAERAIKAIDELETMLHELAPESA